MFGLKYRKDVFESLARELPSYAPSISKGVVRELRGMSLNKGRKGATARLALALLKSKKVNVYNINANVDRWIERQASSARGSAVVTNDTELASRLAAMGVRCLKLSMTGALKPYAR